MKTPLRFQITEYDCGATSLINALTYLFEREEILPDLIKEIHTVTLDEFDNDGGQGGTSRYAINLLTHWFNSYAIAKNLSLKCERLVGTQVNLDKMRSCVKNKGVVLVRLFQTSEHYVILTDIDDTYVYLFDPYYLDEKYYDVDKMVEIIFDKPFKYNRRVSIERFLSEGKKDFSLGRIGSRECVLMERKQ